MSPGNLVSAVIPCYNPSESVFETIASVRAQTYPNIEIVLVNDGTVKPESLRVLERASRLVDRCIEQENRGPGAARNAGFAAAAETVLQLDSDDLVHPEYVEECLRQMRAHPSAAFVYTGIEVFGLESRTETGEPYNLYGLLDRNYLTSAALVRKADWKLVGGYQESRGRTYEDWEFWLHLGAHGRYGVLLPKPLLRYRKHRPSVFEISPAHHYENVANIRAKHPELYGYEGRLRIKSAWAPAVYIAGQAGLQTIGDVQYAGTATPPGAAGPPAAAFLVPGPDGADSHAAEMAALAVWGGKGRLLLPDGSLALSRKNAADRAIPAAAAPVPRAATGGGGATGLRQHFLNAGLNSWEEWLRHPLRSALRMVPLRMKERINRAAGRPVFDLSFYLQFQPSSVLAGGSLVKPLHYMPFAATRRRIALVTPHLGPGGAEGVLLDLAASLDRSRFEILLIATHSRDDSWTAKWRAAVDHVYDLAPLVPPERRGAAVYSMVINWRCEAVLVQKSFFGYAALPPIRKDAPGTRMLALLHAAGNGRDAAGTTIGGSRTIDVWLVVSEEVRQRLLAAGIPERRIRFLRGGVNLERGAELDAVDDLTHGSHGPLGRL